MKWLYVKTYFSWCANVFECFYNDWNFGYFIISFVLIFFLQKILMTSSKSMRSASCIDFVVIPTLTSLPLATLLPMKRRVLQVKWRADINMNDLIATVTEHYINHAICIVYGVSSVYTTFYFFNQIRHYNKYIYIYFLI